jgi:hypothetical protein
MYFHPATVQNVQNATDDKAHTTSSTSFERFERFERPSGDIETDAGVSAATPLKAVLQAIERRCPDHVNVDRWGQAVEDGRRFLAQWGEQAEALGWGAEDLFGLHAPPATPHPSYRRLSRHDATGLIWLLRGRQVIVLTADTADIAISGGGKLTFHRIISPWR